MDLIPNDWKQITRSETHKKFLLKTFCCKNKATRKIKDFQKISNKEIYFTLQSNNSKYNNFFMAKFYRRTPYSHSSNFGKIFTDWFKKWCWDKLIHFSLPLNSAIHRMVNKPNILCPRCWKKGESYPILHSIAGCSR